MREADIDIRLMDYYLSDRASHSKLHDSIDTPESPSTASDNLKDKLADDPTDAH